MSTQYEFEVTHKSGLVDCFSVTSDAIASAWETARRQTGADTIKTAQVRNPKAFGSELWHTLPEARRAEHVNRVRANKTTVSTGAHA